MKVDNLAHNIESSIACRNSILVQEWPYIREVLNYDLTSSQDCE